MNVIAQVAIVEEDLSLREVAHLEPSTILEQIE